MSWPPARRDQVQGAIGRRPAPGADDLRKVLSSREFRSLAGNPQFQQFAAGQQTALVLGLPGVLDGFRDRNLQRLAGEPHFQAMLQNVEFQSLLQNPEFQNRMAQTGQAPGEIHGLPPVLAQYRGLAKDGNMVALLQNPDFRGLFAGGRIGPLLSNLQFIQSLQSPALQTLLQNPAFLSFLELPGAVALMSNLQVQSLAQQMQLQNLVDNAELRSYVVQSHAHAAGFVP